MGATQDPILALLGTLGSLGAGALNASNTAFNRGLTADQIARIRALQGTMQDRYDPMVNGARQQRSDSHQGALDAYNNLSQHAGFTKDEQGQMFINDAEKNALGYSQPEQKQLYLSDQEKAGEYMTPEERAGQFYSDPNSLKYQDPNSLYYSDAEKSKIDLSPEQQSKMLTLAGDQFGRSQQGAADALSRRAAAYGGGPGAGMNATVAQMAREGGEDAAAAALKGELDISNTEAGRANTLAQQRTGASRDIQQQNVGASKDIQQQAITGTNAILGNRLNALNTGVQNRIDATKDIAANRANQTQAVVNNRAQGTVAGQQARFQGQQAGAQGLGQILTGDTGYLEGIMGQELGGNLGYSGQETTNIGNLVKQPSTVQSFFLGAQNGAGGPAGNGGLPIFSGGPIWNPPDWGGDPGWDGGDPGYDEGLSMPGTGGQQRAMSGGPGTPQQQTQQQSNPFQSNVYNPFKKKPNSLMTAGGPPNSSTLNYTPMYAM